MPDETKDFTLAGLIPVETVLRPGPDDTTITETGQGISATSDLRGGDYPDDLPDLDIDVFELGSLRGMHTINVLPDWAKLNAGGFIFMSAEASIMRVTIYEEALRVNSTTGAVGGVSYKQVAVLGTAPDSILAALHSDATFFETPTFSTIDFNFTGPRDGPDEQTIIGIYHDHFTGRYFLKVETYHQPDYVLPTFGSYTYTHRYAIGVDLATGLRADLWGADWVNQTALGPPVDPGPTPFSTLPEEAHPIVVAQTEETKQVETRPFNYDPATDHWTMPATDTQPAYDPGPSGDGQNAFWQLAGDLLADEFVAFVDDQITDAGEDPVDDEVPEPYQGIKDAIDRVADVKEVVGNWFRDTVKQLEDGLNNFDNPNFDSVAWQNQADERTSNFQTELEEKGKDQLNDATKNKFEGLVDGIMSYLRHSDVSVGMRFADDTAGYTFDLPNGHANALLGGARNETINGGDLTDLVNGGGGDDRLFGNAGKDSLGGGAGNDELHGGIGDDTLIGGAGADQLFGDDGDDTLYGAFDPRFGAQPGDAGDVLHGGAGNDLLRGGDLDDQLFGEDGDDNLRGDAGSDLLDGGPGMDFASLAFAALATPLVLDLSTFDPRVSATFTDPLGGTDTLVSIEKIAVTGTAFDDRITGSTLLNPASGFANQLSGGLGNDIITGADFRDLLVGDGGDDQLFGRGGSDVLDGLDGNDQLFGEGGTDTLYGAAGNDLLVGGFSTTPGAQPDDGADTLYGEDGNDVLRGGEGDDKLYGDAGDDNLRGDAGNDLLDGGTGRDFVSFNFAAHASPIDLDLSALDPRVSTTFADPRGGTDTLVSIEYIGVTGTSGADRIVGSAFATSSIVNNTIYSANQLFGGDGNDIVIGASDIDSLNGESGNDTLTGNGNRDFLSGGAGNDRIEIAAAGSGSFVNGGADIDTLAVSGAVTLSSLVGIEAIELSAGNLTLTGAQVTSGLALNTTITGTGSLTVNMTAGQLLAAKLWSIAPGITVTINGTSGIDIMKLANAVQTVNGGDGTDQIKGGNQVDTINGGAGVDKIMGLGGADILTGGLGNDVFRYLAQSDSTAGAGADRITDFVIGEDRLNFANIDTNPVLAGSQGFAFVGTAAFAGGGLALMRYLTSGSDLIVQADVDGDGTADMEVILQGLAGQTLTSAQFVLGTPPAMEPLSAQGIGGGVDMLPDPGASKAAVETAAFVEDAIVAFQPEAYLHDARFSMWGFVNELWLI